MKLVVCTNLQSKNIAGYLCQKLLNNARIYMHFLSALVQKILLQSVRCEIKSWYSIDGLTYPVSQFEILMLNRRAF